MKEQFSILIEELGSLIEMDLHLDANDSCTLLLEETLPIQIEENDNDEIVIGSFVGELPAGRFREDVLHNALQQNYLSHDGVFAYNEPNNQLTYFSLLPLRDLTAPILKEVLAEFSTVAMSWFEALKKGLPSPDNNGQTKSSDNPFNLS